jgi:hypothetical protein
LHGDAYTYSCHAYTDAHNCPYLITDAFCQPNANRQQSHTHRYVRT